MNCTINVKINQITIQKNKIEWIFPRRDIEENDQEFQVEKIRQILNTEFTPKKRTNMMLSAAYAVAKLDNGKEKARRLAMCARWLEFAVNEEKERYKITKTSSCHVRLCPVCQWRRSVNTFRNMARIYAQPEIQKHKHMFLTLTQKNVPEEQLGDELKKISRAFTNLMKKKEVKDIVKGYMRSTEVTRNMQTGMYHPHIHAIITVPKSYGSREYITKDRFSELWASVQNLDYSPVIDIRMIKKMDGKALAEIAKYSVKPTDYLLDSEIKTAAIIENLDPALDGKRFVSYGGIIKDMKRKLMGNRDIETEDTEIIPEFEEWEKIVYEWHFGTQTYNRIL